MAKAYVFYNPLAGEGKILEDLELMSFVIDEECVFCDMTKPETYEKTLFAMEASDYLILCGGDGTLNRFVNILGDIQRPNEIYYYPAGENNDFALDFRREYGCNPFPITKSVWQLPKVCIGDKWGLFLTGVVFSADYRFDAKAGRGDRKGKNKPCSMRLSVNKALLHYEKVRFAAVMQGRYCGGGLLPDPSRRRTDRQLSCVVIHSCGRLKEKRLIRALRKGKIPKSRCLTIHRGLDLRLDFDAPVTVLTDGEIHRSVTTLTARGREQET